MDVLTWICQLPKRRKLRKSWKNLHSSVVHTLAADDDILSDEIKEKYRVLRDDLVSLKRAPLGELEQGLKTQYIRYEKLAGPKTFAKNMLGFLDVLAVALSVAFGIRGVFLQPFQIPTSSMQPTLYGVHFIDKKEAAPYQNIFTKLLLPLSSSEAKITALDGGYFEAGGVRYSRGLADVLMSAVHPSQMYFDSTDIRLGSYSYRIPGADPRTNIYRYLDFNPEGKYFNKGQTVFDGYSGTGDHLFVDRYSIHFAPLKRGEVFVFNTEGLKTRDGYSLPGYYYIKRVAGLGGDTLKIIKNKLYIRPKGENDFRPSDEFSDKFKKVNSMRGGYQGHLPYGLLANEQEFTVPEDCYFALGDNTANSLDSREWSCVPKHNIIGRALFVFWPVSRRFGLTDRMPAIDVPTVYPEGTSQPSAMRLQ